jgi:hypothetical protein
LSTWAKLEKPYLKDKIKKIKGWDEAQIVDCLPSKCRPCIHSQGIEIKMSPVVLRGA